MVIIGLGANLPSGAEKARNPAETLHDALCHLGNQDVVIGQVSRFYRTPAWPDPADPPFVNAVALVETKRDPLKFLEMLHATERVFGRVRTMPNAPRTLDLDLLDYDGLVQLGPPELPHPRMTQRAFVLVPLSDVAPHWRDPKTGQSLAELIGRLPVSDRAAVEPIS